MDDTNMRILIFSDIHTEFWKEQFGFSGKPVEFPLLPDPDSYDIVIAAGDIGLGLAGFNWLEKNFPNKQVLYVPGNHEYYKHDYFKLQEQFNNLNKLNNSNVTVLNPASLTIDGVKFVGATLWSDLRLKGYPDFPDYIFENGIADFRLIKTEAYNKGAMDSVLMREIYNNELEFIKTTLEETSVEQMKKTVVVTHFVPSQLLIEPKWLQPRFQTLNPYFTNDLDYEIFDYGFPLMVYGHTHDRNDKQHPLGTRMIGQPFGYPNENANRYDWKIVEV
jgi:predicted phosphodiesterase